MFGDFLPHAVLFSLGPIGVRWYGVMLAAGALAGYVLMRRLARERGVNVAELDSLIAALLVVGLLGARLFDVLVFESWYFLSQPWEIFVIWRGGLAFHGGLLAGVLFLVWWCRKRAYPVLTYVDLLAPGLAVGQAIGRWGNYFNQELFGKPTALPWGIPIHVNLRPEQYQDFTHFHPVFLYEFMALSLFALVLWRLRKRLTGGKLFALYLVVSGTMRFALEFLRVDEQSSLLGARVGFWVAGITIAVGAALFWYARRKIQNRPV